MTHLECASLQADKQVIYFYTNVADAKAATLPLIIFTHPLGMSSAVWSNVIEKLTTEYRVICWDLPGHGKSPTWIKEQGPLSIQQLTQQVLALADHYNCARFYFVGTSIGGAVGLQLLHDHPERVAAALLTNTGIKIGTAEAWFSRAAMVRTQGLSSLAETLCTRWFAANYLQSTAFSAWVTGLQNTDDESYAQLCEALAEWDITPQFANQLISLSSTTNFPRVQCLAGRQDIATPVEKLEEVQRLLANQSMQLQPLQIFNCGHVPAVELPEQFSQLLLQWLPQQ